VSDDLGHGSIHSDGWRISIDPSLRELPPEELVQIIEWQANQLRILKNKARQRAEQTDELERQLQELRK
jgi:hypothetical protein